MGFNLSKTDSSLYLFDRIQASLWMPVKEAAPKYQLIRLTGPFIGIASLMLKIASGVALIAEVIFKGCANLYYGNLEIAAEQLLRNLPIAMSFLPLSILIGSTQVISDIFCMAVYPQEYSSQKCEEFYEVSESDLVDSTMDKIDFTHCNQVYELRHRMCLYVECHTTGVFQRASFFTIKVIAAAAAIGEALLKALSNLLGASFSHEFHFKRGIVQLTEDFPLYLCAFPVSILFAGVELIHSDAFS